MTSSVDTNVLLYALGPILEKQARAEEIISAGGLISVQVLNEFVLVARRKLKLDLPTALAALESIKPSFEIVPVTLAVHERAMQIAATTNFRIYDCNIIAAADLSSCDVLFSEDMHHGQRVGGVTIINPFMAATSSKS
jgi:predicted nucleic acid-binding protein